MMHGAAALALENTEKEAHGRGVPRSLKLGEKDWDGPDHEQQLWDEVQGTWG